jgi:hypothetical protein
MQTQVWRFLSNMSLSVEVKSQRKRGSVAASDLSSGRGVPLIQRKRNLSDTSDDEHCQIILFGWLAVVYCKCFSMKLMQDLSLRITGKSCATTILAQVYEYNVEDPAHETDAI